MKKDNSINWFWAHRRNASLHHFSILMHGLAGKGWLPAVDFWFDNQIVVGVPGKGCYIFYDKNQLTSTCKYRNVQKSIDSNKNFARDFKRRTDEIFGAMFFKAMAIDEAILPLLPDRELYELYKEFIGAMLVGPIITVQLWGIEACFDENYIIMKFLRKRLRELGKGNELQNYKKILAVNTGETVAFSEQKDFYRIMLDLNTPVLKKLFLNNSLYDIEKNITKYAQADELINKYIEKYEWVHTEYVSSGWDKKKWLKMFKDAFNSQEEPKDKLNEIIGNFNKLNKEKREIIKELNPGKEVLHAIDSLSELISQRDWSKGYFTKLLLSYGKLLNETARRMGITTEEILHYSYPELESYFREGKKIPQKELANRVKNGFIIEIKNAKLRIISGKKNIENLIKSEGIEGPFQKLALTSSFTGLGASRGIIRGRARVLESARELSSLKDGEILVTYMTTIEFTPVFRKIKGLVTDEGGMSCHAAIISRELNIPCVVGTNIATRVIETGELIEVDGNKGSVRILNKN